MGVKQGITPGGIAYRHSGRKVKNVNLRVCRDGTVSVSAPRTVSKKRLEEFVDAHAEWIAGAQQAAARQAARDSLPLPDKKQALAHFTALSDRVFPLFAGVLQGEKPVIQVRDMKSRWGVCHYSQKRIVFALRLYQMPMEAQIYVVVHEYCHFLVHGHPAAFWAGVAKILPDWKARRAMLRQ